MRYLDEFRDPVAAKALVTKWFGSYPKLAKPQHKPVAQVSMESGAVELF